MKKSKGIDWKAVFSLQYIIYTVLGSFIAVIALQGFMIPNNFVDGGVTAVSILFRQVFHIHISIFLLELISLLFILATG